MRAYFVSEKHIELDIHGMTVEEAKLYLEMSLATNRNQIEEIIVIHGYHNGTVLKNFIQNEFKSKYIAKKYLWLNPGITSFILNLEN